MSNLSPVEAQAIVNLRASKDWPVFVLWLTQKGDKWNQVLIDAGDPDRRAVSAGMVRAVNDILKDITSASELLNTFKRDK